LLLESISSTGETITI